MTKQVTRLFLEAFIDRNEDKGGADEEGSKCHAVNSLGLCEDNEADERPQQHDAGHLKFG